MGATDTPESQGQLIVALAIVLGMAVIALALIVASIITKDSDYTKLGVGVVIGAFANALNAPTGIARVLQAAKAGAGPQPSPPKE